MIFHRLWIQTGQRMRVPCPAFLISMHSYTTLFAILFPLFSTVKKFFAFFIVSEFTISDSSKMQMPSGFSGIFDFL